MITTPEETSVISEGSPLEKIPRESLAESLHLTRWNWFLFREQIRGLHKDTDHRRKPVASTAPKIPIPNEHEHVIKYNI